jgi:hypothetical protein
VTNTVHLGYALGSGDPVSIPIRHTVVTGITQEAGKTTTLEALIARSGMRGLAFVTKRGERAFSRTGDDPTIRPYFREQTDWRFVSSILEAALSEKMKFERSWIMRASKGARTLADVQRNVRRELEKAKGLNADIYYQLDQYLDEIVPHISRVRWATSVELRDGLNVMDLTQLSEAMQHLVIRSSMLWILEKEENTIVVVPEAWKFAPEQRGAPVKLAAEAFIRQGAGLGNYLWIDSQDIVGVDKKILKQCPVWILGVQRESNEIKRTLAQIPKSTSKPKPEAIATLEVGQFIACFGKHTIPTYVQPLWLAGATAQTIARGELDVAKAHLIERARRRPAPTILEDSEVKESEARLLEQRNETLERENEDLRRRLEKLEEHDTDDVEVPRGKVRGDRTPAPAGEGAMSEQFYEAIRARLLRDPVALKVATMKRELDVEVRIEKVEADGTSWIGRTAQLLAEGFFNTPKKSGVVFTEAARRGAKGIPARADEACKKLLALGFLTRESEGFQAVPNMKVNIIRK